MTLKSFLFITSILFIGLNTYSAKAQNSIGGHFGFVQPIITIQDGETSDGFDPYTIGFPIGITVRKNEKFAFDLEFVPFIGSNRDNYSSVNELIIHPGLLWGIGNKLTFGNRIAFETKSGRYGITPLLNKGFLIGKTNVFAEFVLPLRVGNNQEVSITTALHFGIGF
ncbi:hypothetical protein A8C32_01465 [Flavivirga aquatica]|uniref:Outer membrane protein beta-barrel domain-containing protein n=1 Tax=Flavivirga aquatica TaxID=1849968 RepID=A0A1E5TA15_9FLAO|nr:hypothetical protein [Flavivirga aquatica]OEK08157.1 hypothetical protein A8C32_01465 [Flavivirga aquatica]